MIKSKRLAKIVLALSLIAAVLVFVEVSPAVAQDPSSGPDGSAAPALDVVTTTVRDWLTIVGAILSIAVVIGGGILARRNAQIFRAKSPHVVISHEVSHRPVGNNYVHIFVTAVLHNSSRVHIEFLDGFAAIFQVSPATDDDVEYLYEEVFDIQQFANVQWPYLDGVRHRWDKDGLLVEPGETETEIFDFIVQKEVQSVIVNTYFYNSRVVGKIPDNIELDAAERRKRKFRRWMIEQGPLGWGRASVYDMMRNESEDAN